MTTATPCDACILGRLRLFVKEKMAQFDTSAPERVLWTTALVLVNGAASSEDLRLRLVERVQDTALYGRTEQTALWNQFLSRANAEIDTKE